MNRWNVQGTLCLLSVSSFNNSVAVRQIGCPILQICCFGVARVKYKKNETKEENLDNENGVEDTPSFIDRKGNVFNISNPKSKYPTLQLDLRLISDLVVVIISATCGGIAFAYAGQSIWLLLSFLQLVVALPSLIYAGQSVITEYLLAGSVIDPGSPNFC